MTETERYAAMLRDEVAPRLRAIGFFGSGRRYVLPDGLEWLVVAFQRNRWNDEANVEFTINLFRVAKADWKGARSRHPRMSEQPTGGAVERPGRYLRLHHLLPTDAQWWAVRAGVDTAVLAGELVEALGRYGVPWLRGEIRHSDEL